MIKLERGERPKELTDEVCEELKKLYAEDRDKDVWNSTKIKKPLKEAMLDMSHISWGVIFMYAFQLYKHRRKFRYFSDCVADSYEKVFGIILTICRIRHIIIIKRKEHSNVREHFI